MAGFSFISVSSHFYYIHFNNIFSFHYRIFFDSIHNKGFFGGSGLEETELWLLSRQTALGGETFSFL
jgi:lipocalin